jgi:hypothetical protein
MAENVLVFDQCSDARFRSPTTTFDSMYRIDGSMRCSFRFDDDFLGAMKFVRQRFVLLRMFPLEEDSQGRHDEGEKIREWCWFDRLYFPPFYDRVYRYIYVSTTRTHLCREQTKETDDIRRDDIRREIVEVRTENY